MKQILQNYKTGELSVSEVPEPTVAQGYLIVRNNFSLISAGTERSTVDMAKKNLVGKAKERPDLVKKVFEQVKKNGVTDTLKMVMNRLDATAALGYSSVGIVEEVGSGCTGFKKDDLVACAGQNYASHADVIKVPKNLCVKVPQGVEPQQAAYVTMGAIALQGIRQAEPKLGDTVAVIGLGLLGQLTVQMLAANGCHVIASDFDADKLKLAKEAGAAAAVNSADLQKEIDYQTNEQGADIVIITASTKSNDPIAQAGDVCRKKGSVVVVGAVGMSVPRDTYYAKELDLKLSMSYGPGRYDTSYEEKGIDYPYHYVRWTENRNMAAFLQLVQTNKIDLTKLTTHKFLIQDALSAYQLIEENSEPYLGILLDYSESKRDEKPIIELKAVNEKRVMLGLLGAGNHVKDMLMPHIVASKNFAVSAICSGTGVNAKALGDKFGASFITTDYTEVVKNDAVNSVLIGSRHDLHGEMVLAAIKNNKHVFVEKPLCLTHEELEEVSSAREANPNSRIMVGFNRRFSSHAEKIKSFVKKINEPIVMSYRVNAGKIPKEHWIQDLEVGGGRIIGEACHFIDFMMFVCDAAPKQVSAVSVSKSGDAISEDESIITIAFEDGSIGTLIYVAGGAKTVSKERFELFGGGKSVIMDNFMKTTFHTHSSSTTHKTSKMDKGFKQEIAALEEMITNGVEPMSFEEIQSVTLACLEAHRQLRSQ